MRTELRVPGAVWAVVFDPRATDAPRENGWPEPTRRVRRGKGWTLIYERLDREVAFAMVDHAYEWAEAVSIGVDPETARTRSKVERWVEKTLDELGEPTVDEILDVWSRS